MEKMSLFAPVDDKEKQDIIKDLTKNTVAFGIDLGTTNSAISVIPSGNHSVIIPLAEGRTTIPSCVMWTGEGREFIVGKAAYEKRYEENCIYSVKRLMQDVNATVTFKKDGKELVMRPAEVSAEILKGLVKEAGDTYGEIKDVVVTVPAYFDINGKKATKEAVELAGLNLLGIIAEPTAASLCYELAPNDGCIKDIMVYDLGGGTFDVSLVRITDNANTPEKEALMKIYGFDKTENDDVGRTVSVICSDGDTRLGGDDFDIELFNVVMELVRQQGFTGEVSVEDKERLILELEKLKKSGVNSTYLHTCKFTNPESSYRVTITPVEFAKALEPIYQRTRVIVERVLSEHKNSADTLVMVGGSTKNPHLIDKLRRDYPSFIINNAFPPDESVALGAGIHAKELKFGDKAVSVFDSLAIGIGVVEGDKLKNIIPKNSQYPVTKTKIFTNVVDNQESIQVTLMQGNSVYVEEAIPLGTLLIDGLPQVPAENLDIYINLAINANGILNCSTEIHNPSTGEDPIVRNLELNLSKVESTGSKKLSKDEKLVKKWSKKAESLPEPHSTELKNLIQDFLDGKCDKATVMDYLRSCMDIKKEGMRNDSE